MFLIRIAFWLGVLILLLPTEERQQAKLYETAAATVERVATFCDRNPQTCALTSQFWATFLKKAEFGARVAVDLITSRGAKAEAGVAATTKPDGTPAAEPRAIPRNSLTRDDLGPSWRPPGQRAGA